MIGTNVKKGFFFLPLLLMALLMIPGMASAQEKEYVPITGTAFGEKIGLLHFDYRTADSTFSNVNSTYVGPTKQFYNPAFIVTGLNPGFPINGSEDAVAKISTASDDCSPNSCLLRGFIWSDTIGWIALDGTLIKVAINDPTGINEDMEGVTPGYVPADKDTIKDPYTSDMYPRIRKIVSNNKVALIGLAWNRHTGWIRLSSDYSSGTIKPTVDQTKDEWGTWLDTGMDPDFAGVGKDRVQVGRKLHGYAWSEKLGWIKFGAETGDEVAFQAYTNWIPDDTPPLVLAPDKAWFSVGVNTGYNPTVPDSDPLVNKVPGLVLWKGFTLDPQSQINTGKSKFLLRSNEPEPPSSKICTDKGDALNSLSVRTVPMGGKNVSIYDLSVSNLGDVPATEKGYCSYTLSAKIYNGSNLITFIGPGYLPNPMPNPVPANMKMIMPDGITVLVRSGNIDIDETEVLSSSTINPPSVLGDGKQTFGYTVQLMDVKRNPIQKIDCSALYSECPKREVGIKADITNDLLFDLTQSTPTFTPYTTPLMANDYASGGGSAYLTSDEKLLDVNWVASNKIHSIYFASAAPNETYKLDSGSTETLQFLVNNFKYAIQNTDPLPATSKKFVNEADPDGSDLEDDPKTAVPAYTIDDTIGDVNQFMSDSKLDKLFPLPILVLGTTPGLINSGDPTGFNKPLASGSKPATIFFSAPITTDKNPQLASGGLSNVLTVGLPTDLTSRVNNLSDLAIYNDSDPWGLAIDNIITYKSVSNDASVARMQTQQIAQLERENGDPDGALVPVAGENENLAWTDPIDGTTQKTRYEFFDDSGKCYQSSCVPHDPNDSSCIVGLYANCDAMNSPFHSRYSSSHLGKDFCYDVDVKTDPADLCMEKPSGPDVLDSYGTYAVSGEWGIPHKFEKVDGVWPEGKIDRNDVVPFRLKAKGSTNPDGTSAATQEFSFRFTPEKIVTGSINDIQLKLFQDIAYRYPGQMLYSVYTTEPTTNYDVKDVRLEAKGTVVGEQLSTGRKFDTIGSSSTRKLQEQVRRNVAQLTSGLNESLKANCTITGGKKTIASLALIDLKANNPNCVIEDSVSQTTFAYFEGVPGDVLELGNGDTSALTVPNRPFTIILKGGADLFIRNNIRYDDANMTSSLGIILIAAEIGKGANVYLSPTPTNMVGSLYAEGSLIGCSDNPTDTGTCAAPSGPPDGAPNSTRVYYGGGSANVQELKNQLFWQGSIASRNTIAGAGISKKPDGIVCLAGDTDLACAQRYDLDYLRRFTSVVTEYVAADPAATPPQLEQLATSTVMNGGKFSGGGCCGTEDGCTAGAAGVCTLPASLELPTKVVLDGGQSGQIVEAESELSTFYIEPSKRATFIPPGFSLTTGQESTQTIR